MINSLKLFPICLILFICNFSLAQNKNPYKKNLGKADSLASIGQYDKAIIYYEKAIQLQPENITSNEKRELYNDLTKKYAFIGLFEEAQKRTRELFFENLRPEDQEVFLLAGSCLLGVYEALQENYTEALNFNVIHEAMLAGSPNYSSNRHCTFRILTLAGKQKDAINQLQFLLEQNPDPQYIIWLTYLYEKQGNQKMADAFKNKLKEVENMINSGTLKNYDESLLKYGLALISVLKDDHVSAVEYLQSAYELGNKEYYWWKNFNPILRELESNSEYRKLMDKMKEEIDQMRTQYLKSQSN